MDRFVLIAESGIERWMHCTECRAFTPHHIHMVAINTIRHNVSFRAYCKDCLEDCEVGDEIPCNLYIVTVQEWEEILEIDATAPDFMQN